MGVLGLALFIFTLGGIIANAFRLFRYGATETEKKMGAIVWLTAIGLAINGMTAVVFNAITLGWLFFWLAGCVVTVSQRLTAPSPALRELQLQPVK